MTSQLPVYPRQRTVGDVMTRSVVTVTPQTGFKDIVRLLAEHNVSVLLRTMRLDGRARSPLRRSPDLRRRGAGDEHRDRALPQHREPDAPEERCPPQAASLTKLTTTSPGA